MTDWIKALKERVTDKTEAEKLLQKHMQNSFEPLFAVIKNCVHSVNSQIYYADEIKVEIKKKMRLEKLEYSNEVQEYELKIVGSYPGNESKLRIADSSYFLWISHHPHGKSHKFKSSISESGEVIFEGKSYYEIAQLLIQPVVEKDFYLKDFEK